MAITSRICIKPPMVYDVTKPNSQSTIKIIEIVQSIISSKIFIHPGCGCRAGVRPFPTYKDTRLYFSYILGYVFLFHRTTWGLKANLSYSGEGVVRHGSSA